jgi:hypothetical protein
MRLLISLAVGLLVVTAAKAEPQDRYGPPRPAKERALELAALRGYQGPALSWSNKRTARPEPTRTVAVTAPSPEFAPTPAPAQRPSPPPAPRLAYANPVLARPAPAAAIQPAARPAQTSAMPGPRYYSVHREFGLAPDAIPDQPAQPRYVLVGPPDRSAQEDAPKTNPESRAF